MVTRIHVDDHTGKHFKPLIDLRPFTVDEWGTSFLRDYYLEGREVPPIPMTYKVLDLETTVDQGGSPSAISPSNKLVMAGALNQNGGVIHGPSSDVVACGEGWWESDPEGEVYTLIGHNLKFDLRWIIRSNYNYAVQKYPKSVGIWDTQIAHYILTGQKDKTPSLAQACARYDILGKKDTIKDYLAKGVNVDMIPHMALAEYLCYDLLTTETLAAFQIEEATEKGLVPLILAQGQACLALAFIESGGMMVDHGVIKNIADTARTNITKSFGKFSGMATIMAANACCTRARNITPGGRKLLQRMIYGGYFEAEVETQVPKKVGGGFKKKIERYPLHFAPAENDVLDLIPEVLINASQDKQPTGDDVLDIVRLNTLNHSLQGAIEAVQEHRLAQKVLETYIPGIMDNLNLIDRELMHGTLHQTTTGTGRLSSSSPNLQNMFDNVTYPIKSIFKSRWHNEGSIVEGDFSQLEVVALAHLVGPGALQNAIKAGENIHTMSARKVWGAHSHISDDMHRTVKTINFGLIYGGSANSLAAQSGVDVVLCKEVITAFYHLFPEVKSWQLATKSVVDAYVQSHGDVCGTSELGFPIRGTVINMLYTGRLFYFEQADNPFRPGVVAVSPTVVKNYPVQGFATGDIVPLVLGILFRRLYSDPRIEMNMLIINTVHDSFVLDVHHSVLDEVVTILRDTIEKTPMYIKKYYGIEFELPIRGKIKVGPNWGNLKEIP